MSADATAPTPTLEERLQAIFAPWARTDEPGVVVGAAMDGQVIWRAGFGMASLETSVANTPKTRMRIGSTSKHFTALLALLLAEEGKLDLDAPIRAQIPELTGPGGDPTLRQLLQHRGGSRCYLDIGLIGHGMSVAPRGRALESQVWQSGRNFAPGEAMIYNNGGYHLASIAIERAGGAPFEAQLKARLFDPVGMTDTTSVPSDHIITPGIATMHVPTGPGSWRRGLFMSEEVRGEGAIVSTVDDMLRWMAHLRRRDLVGSPGSWAELGAAPVYDDGSLGAYALGLMLEDYRGLRTVHHAGGVMGGTAQMLTFPDDGLDVIVIANGARGADVVSLALKVADVVLEDRLGPEPQKISAEDFTAALGDYWSPQSRMVYSLAEEGGELKLSPAKEPMGLPLSRTAEGFLVTPPGSLGEIAVKPGDNGLELRFGAEAGVYHRLAPQPGDAEAFAAAAVGRYRADDADAWADIAEADGGGLTLSLSDGLGRTIAPLGVLSATVAFGMPFGPMGGYSLTISLDVDGAATGFQLNTSRTRGLAFRRVS